MMCSDGTSELRKKTVRSWLRGMTKRHWAVVLLLGLLLAVVAIPTAEQGNRDRGTGNAAGEMSGETSEKTELEARLETVLESVEGIGRVEVMLMTGQDTQSFYGSEGTEVTGVLIAAEGADNSVTKRNIQEAVMALFQIEAHKIKIMKMK